MNVSRSLVPALSLLALAAPTAAQSFVVRADAAGLEPAGLVRADGSSTVAWTEANDARVAWFDADGDVVNTHELESTSGKQVRVLSLADGPTGGLILAGAADDKPWITSIDPLTGGKMWDHTASDEWGRYRDVDLLDDGRVIACGWRENQSGENETLVTLFSPTGALLWQRIYTDFYGNDAGFAVEPAADGGAWLVGTLPGALRVTRIGASGLMLNVWQKEYDGVLTLSDPRALATADGGLLIAGVTVGGTDALRPCALKLDAAGDVLWARAYSSHVVSYWDAGFMSVAETIETSAGYVVALSQAVPGAPAHLETALLHLDAQGAALAYQNVGFVDMPDEPLALAALPSGELTVASWIDDRGPRLLRLAASGDSGLGCASESPLPAAPETFAPVPSPTIWGFSPETPVATAEHVLPHAFTTTSWIECSNLCEVHAFAFGAGLAGTGGHAPALSGTDGLCLGGGAGPVIELASGLGGAPAVLGFSYGTLALPVLGGWLWIDPSSSFSVPVVLDGPAGVAGAGGLVLPVTIDLTPLQGLQLHAQAFVIDPGAVQGIAMSGALTLDVD